MTMISPLLQNKISSMGGTKDNRNLSNHHEKIYQDLQKRANDVKPNEAKAVLVEEGMLGNPITYTKDIIQDGKNFFKAVKTGQMGDNNLGRINDFGLKIGAALIASFLALHSKTKTESLMRFIGGATFIAAMEMWPKLFINIPARLVHGFRIDRKYISAQGDKKDFFLDNQFLVWDAYPEEQLRKDAKNAGIDYDSKNGKEKIQRKMQKTALQNRTLWMATAGFATPLLTSMVGNFAEPKVQEAIANHGVDETNRILSGNLKAHLDGKKTSRFGQKLEESKLLEKIKSSKLAQRIIEAKAKKAKPSEFDSLLETYKNSALDDNFYKKLEELFNPATVLQNLKDSDDAKPLENWTPYNLTHELKEAQKQLQSFDKENLAAQLMSVKTKEFDVDLFEFKTISQDKIRTILANLGDNLSYENVKAVLEDNNIAPEEIKRILAQTKTSNKEFFEFIRELNDGPIAQMRQRAKAYLELINPVAGSKFDAATTVEFNKTMNKVFKSFKLDGSDTLKKLGGYAAEGTAEATAKSTELISENVRNIIQGFVTDVDENGMTVFDEKQYAAFIQSLKSEPIDRRAKSAMDALRKDENIKAIIPDAKEIKGVKLDGIKKALLGAQEADEGVIRIIKDYITKKEVDSNAIKLKPILSANFERRVLEFQNANAKKLAKLTGEEKEALKNILKHLESMFMMEQSLML